MYVQFASYADLKSFQTHFVLNFTFLASLLQNSYTYSCYF